VVATLRQQKHYSQQVDLTFAQQVNYHIRGPSVTIPSILLSFLVVLDM
jgi:hypothetical protein